MFDIGFWEIALVGVIALLVLGPERLPKVARVAGMWIGKGKRFMATVKGDIDRELKADELRRIMSDQAKSNDLYEITEQAKEGLAKATVAFSQPSVKSSATDSSAAKPAAAVKAVKAVKPGRAAAKPTSAKSTKEKADEPD